MTEFSHPELVGAADRAGGVVRDQVSAMVEAAQATASEFNSRAREAGEATRREALESAGRVVDEIGRLEHELTQLRRFVAAEADGLRAKVDRSRLLHASAMGSGAPMALSGPPPEVAMGALSAGPEAEAAETSQDAAGEDGASDDSAKTTDEARDTSAAPEAEPETPAAADEPISEEPISEEPISEEAASEETASETPAPAPAPGAVGPHDIEKTRGEMATASDVELAELHVLANARAAGPFDDEKEAAYWPAVVRATVEEAAGRPDFGQDKPGDPPIGRKARKQRKRTLRPLLTARQEAVEAESGGDASPQSGAGPSTDAPKEDTPAEADEKSDSPGLGGRRKRSLTKAARRGNRPFLDVAGQCAVCGQTFLAESEDALAKSGWLVNDQVGLCPDDQKLGWELPEGHPFPYKRGGS